jgi:hypothetical protein
MTTDDRLARLEAFRDDAVTRVLALEFVAVDLLRQCLVLTPADERAQVIAAIGADARARFDRLGGGAGSLTDRVVDHIEGIFREAAAASMGDVAGTA